MRTFSWSRGLSRAAAFALFLAALAPSARSQDMEGPGDGGQPEMPAESRSVNVGGEQRWYIAHIPANVAKPAPVVFVFHGGGGRPQGIARVTGMNDVADQQGFVAVYPAGATAPSGRGGTWNVGGAISPSSANDVGFVRAILHDLERTLPVDHSRIYATGMSMGGVFSYRLACQMSSTFAAIAPVSATMVEPSCRPHSAVAVLHTHGSDDDRIPLQGGHGAMTAANRSWPAPANGVESWSHFDGCQAAPARTDEGGMSCTTYGQCRATVEYCVIGGGGHVWPEGMAARAWAFFSAHQKQGEVKKSMSSRRVLAHSGKHRATAREP